jgi:hypothetical protein
MCRLLSAIITKKETLYDLDNDSHEDLIKKAGLKDTTDNPDFVRVEMVPKDGNVFNHDMKNWVLKIDQDFRPEWFSEKFAEAEMRKAVKVLWEERFVINREVKEVKTGRWFVGKGGTVQEVWDGGTVQEVLDGGTVIVFNGSFKEIKGSGIVILRNENKIITAKDFNLEVRK